MDKINTKLKAKVNIKKIATVAQLVEQRIRNAWVGGSIPLGGSYIYKENNASCYI